MTSSTSNFKRTIPKQKLVLPLASSFFLVILLALIWEIYCRSLGFQPALDDKKDLWAINMEKVKPDDTVFIGASRHLHNMNIYTWEQERGKKPIQLSISSTSARIILDYFANHTDFKGTIVMGMISAIFFAQEPSTYLKPKKYLNYFEHFSLAQKISFYIGLPLDSNFSFIEQTELSLDGLIKKIPFTSKRTHTYYYPPPYFSELDIHRNTVMTQRVLNSNELQQISIERTLLPIYNHLSITEGLRKQQSEIYLKNLFAIRDKVKKDISKIKDRGGKVIIISHPKSGKINELANKVFPKNFFWDQITKSLGANKMIHYSEYESLRKVPCCSDESHLSPEFARHYTKAIIDIIYQ